jgi:cytochrome c peroxidase
MMASLLLLIALAIPLGLDLYMPVPEDNPLTVEKVELGQRLFNDVRLSRDRSISCASCHDPARAFSSAQPLAIGVFNRVGRRNAPALINRGYGRLFFWDGRIRSLEEQVLKPIEDPNEMDVPVNDAAARVGLSAEDLSRALASYVRSILSGNSPYDRYVAGERRAMTADQQAGLQIFRGKGNCTACHVGPNFTDERLHNTGVAWRPSTGSGQAHSDGEVSSAQPEGSFADDGGGNGTFKTPTLREVASSAPYMHDGSLRTLEDVVKYYNEGARANPSLDREIHPLHLTPDECQALVAFLRALFGTQSVVDSR